MDPRESGPEIARALTAGVAAGGGEALLIGVAAEDRATLSGAVAIIEQRLLGDG